MFRNDTSLEMELTALSLLERSEVPVGSARLTGVLRAAGIEVAEATAGRYLRRLDEQGLTRSKGAKLGRVITEAGKERLRNLRLLQRQDEYGARLLQAVNSTETNELIDLLYVRRAVEAEAARLAALRATDAELSEIAALAGHHVQEVGQGQDTVRPSMRFHRLVAEASHNRMLISVAMLLLDPANDLLEKALARIATDAGTVLEQAEDHVALSEVLRVRDAAEAESVMRRHLDRLIREVEEHRDRQRHEGDLRGDPCG